MENAVDALKMAFAVIVFVIALGIAFAVFSQAREVADIMLKLNDKTNYEQYVESHVDKSRIVGIETIIPTVRRYVYDNENYSVEIVDGSDVYTFDLLVDQEMNKTPKQIRDDLEKSLEKLLKKYKNARFKETYSEKLYRGDIEYSDNGETIEKINTDTKVKITYTKQ